MAYSHFCKSDVAAVLDFQGQVDDVIQREGLGSKVPEVVHPAGLRPPVAREEPETYARVQQTPMPVMERDEMAHMFWRVPNACMRPV